MSTEKYKCPQPNSSLQGRRAVCTSEVTVPINSTQPVKLVDESSAELKENVHDEEND